eukprot:Em0017g805a
MHFLALNGSHRSIWCCKRPLIIAIITAAMIIILIYSLGTSKEFRFNPSAAKGYHFCSPQFLENQGPPQCQHTFDPPLPTSNTIIVTFINKEWIPLAQNWICSAERVGLSNALYLVAMEPNVCQHFPNTPCYQHPTAAIEGTYFGQPGYQQFMIERTRFILSMLPCTKSHVLLSDTDIVFKKNPIALLDSELVNHDIVFQEDSTGIYLMDSFVTYIFSYICGGFVYLKPSNEMVDFYRSVLTYQLNWNWNDQAGLNICIRHWSRSLRWKTLDKMFFPNGKEFFHFHPDNMMALAVHANFMPRTADKVANMIGQGVWCLKETGPKYCREYRRSYCEGVEPPAVWCKSLLAACCKLKCSATLCVSITCCILQLATSPSLGLHLNPNEMQIAIKWWLGKVTTPPTLAILTEASLSECVVAVDTENGKRRANDAKCTMLGSCQNSVNSMILLRDRLVCGIRVKVQRRLLTEAFGKAFELAQVAELADKNVEDLQRPQTTEEQQLPRQSTEVHSENWPGSSFQNLCMLPLSSEPVGEEEDAPGSKQTYNLFKLGASEPMRVSVKANNVTLVEVDTGAAASVISKKTYERLWRRASLDLLVVAGDGPSLMGRDWLDSSLQNLLRKYADLFTEELGLVKGVTAKLQVDGKAQPRFYKPRTVPYALRSRVEELARLEREGILEPVTHSEWAAPVAAYDTGCLMKLFRLLEATCHQFDLQLAYTYQEESSSSSSFTKYTEELHKLRVARAKLAEAQDSLAALEEAVMYVGVAYGEDSPVTDILIRHALDRRQSVEKMEMEIAKTTKVTSKEFALHDDPFVKGLDEALQSFKVQRQQYFGGVFVGNHIHKTLQNLADTLATLYKLPQKQEKWLWGPSQEKAFNKAKAQLTSPCLLAHFDPAKELILSCDASPFGTCRSSSVTSVEDGVKKPIAFASRSLAPAERKYSHIEKEVPIMASGRTMRWALTLSAYEYRIEYRPAGKMGNADGLSRLPVEEAPDVVPLPRDVVLMMETLADRDSPVTLTTIRTATARDCVLSKVQEMVLKEVVVSDNGTAFTSMEFQTFMKRNGIRHVCCAPYHPSSNGLAERAVQTFKEAMKKTKGNIDVRIARFLFQYRITPHATTGQSPAQLLLKHWTWFQMLVKEFKRIKNARKWIMTEELKFAHLGKGIANRGPLSLTIQFENGAKVNRLVDHSDEDADDDLLPPPVALEQDQNAPADQQELPPPPVMDEAPPPAAVTIMHKHHVDQLVPIIPLSVMVGT